jgi:hypothetical protein
VSKSAFFKIQLPDITQLFFKMHELRLGVLFLLCFGLAIWFSSFLINIGSVIFSLSKSALKIKQKMSIKSNSWQLIDIIYQMAVGES